MYYKVSIIILYVLILECIILTKIVVSKCSFKK